MRFGTLAGVAALVSILAAPVVAQPSGSTAKADELFNQGRTLLEAGKYKQACNKFEESLEEADALGTRLNLALCMEKRGKAYTAMVKFEDTAERAKREGDPTSESAAREHAAAMRELVPTLTVRLAKPVPGAKITLTRPGEPDQAILEGDAVQTDPTDADDAADKITVRVTAPGYDPYTSEPFVLPPKTRHEVAIPGLTAEAGIVDPPVTTPPKSRRKLYAIGLAVAGAGLTAGSALWANSIQDNAKDGCEMRPEGCNYTDGEKTKLRYITTPMAVVGVAAIGVGVYLFFTAPSSRESSERTAVVPTVTPESAGISVLGHF
jgi:hypothetical protein